MSTEFTDIHSFYNILFRHEPSGFVGCGVGARQTSAAWSPESILVSIEASDGSTREFPLAELTELANAAP